MKLEKGGHEFQHEPERKSGIVRIVGAESQEEQRVLSDIGEKVFRASEKLEVPEFYEVSKTPEQKQVIQFLIKEMPSFVEKYGSKPLGLTEDHVVLLRGDLLIRLKKIWNWKRRRGTRIIGATYSIANQRIKYFYNSKESLLGFAHSLAHELLHFHSFQSMNIENPEGDQALLIQRHTGFNVIVDSKDKDGKDKIESYFNNLDEAVIEELTRRFDEAVLVGCPIGAIQEDIKERTSTKDYLAESGGCQLAYEVVSVENGGRSVVSVYTLERNRLKEIIAEIYGKNEDQFGSEEEVFDVFARAVMSGRFLPLARLIEKTFGK